LAVNLCRRARAMPLIGQDPSRQPDALFAGPDLPVDEAVRKRFFGEDCPRTICSTTRFYN
jgi:hypothetical protein